MKLYFKYFSIHLKSQMQYKATFFLNIFGRIIMSFATVLGVLFMFTRFNEVEGFTLSQTLLCTSVVTMAFSFAEVFARGFDIFPRLLGNGEFDRALVRPRGIIFQVL
ncbi:MAG: ABC-2 family transporter protein, partial [Ruminiclostridium sp.]|nr:ABC-2 family transporter protein [Ruminiclostridium sp.]